MEVASIREIARSSQNPAAATIRLGIFPTLGPYLLPHVIPSLHRELPDLELLLVEEKTEELLRRLRDGRLDAVIVATPIVDDGLHGEPLFTEDFVLATPDRPSARRARRAGVGRRARRRTRPPARGGALPARPGAERLSHRGCGGARRFPGDEPRDPSPDGGGRRRRDAAAGAGGARTGVEPRRGGIGPVRRARHRTARSPCSGARRARSTRSCRASPRRSAEFPPTS